MHEGHEHIHPKDNEFDVFLNYFLKHNVSHTEELESFIDGMESRPEVYAHLSECVKAYKQGNEQLKAAIEKLSEVK